MIPVGSAAAVRALDAAVIGQVGVPGRQLMELAGRGAAEILHERYPAGAVGILCGPGNNGGDGYVVARWLAHWGRPVRLWASAPPATEDARVNAALCQRMGLEPLPSPREALAGAAVAVDALLGTGQRAAPRGAIAEGVAALRASAAPVVALDLPTGVDTDTGQALGDPVEAALTITLGRWKLGLLAEPGASLAGDVACVDIGLALAALVDPALPSPQAQILEEADIRAWEPAASPAGAKWDRGHVAVRAGGGAAVLAAHGAFRAGAGLVTLLAPREEWPRLHGLWPEVILAEPSALDPRRHDALVLGPGLGTGESQAEEVAALWAGFPGAVVADADALTLLARKNSPPPSGEVRVLTPHSAEAARLLGQDRAAIDADRFAAVSALRAWGAPLLKGPNSLIGAETTWILPFRSARLATAGSGDVLSGLVAGLLARGLPPDRALAVAGWRHGSAGLAMPPEGTASDLIEALRKRED